MSYGLGSRQWNVLHLIVLLECQGFTAQTHQALDIKSVLLVRPQARDAMRVKNHNLAALRQAEIVRQPVHKQVVSGMNPKF